MDFHPADAGRDSVWAAPQPVTLRLLQESLSATRGLAGAIYALDPRTSTYGISTSFGIDPGLIDTLRPELVFSIGDPRGLVGWVASTREPMYLPDFDAKASWFNEKGVLYVGSVYLVPIVGADDVPAIVAVISDATAAFSSDFRGAIDALVGFASRAYGFESTLRAHFRDLERSLRGASLEWAEILDALDPRPSGDGAGPLRALSQREWEVVVSLRLGKRVATIARELDISPNTVRNHVKSICRKLGVRTHDELRERIGALKMVERVKPELLKLR